MMVVVLTMRFHAPFVHSLKQKRSVVKSLTAKIENKFHISVAEAAEQDVLQTIVICVAALIHNNKQADSIAENIISFAESVTDAEMIDIFREIR